MDSKIFFLAPHLPSSRSNSSSLCARSTLPMGIAPRGYGRVLVVDHRLQFSSSSFFFVELFLKIIFLLGARLALLMGVAPESMFGYL
jgi:hypothetical protein